MIQHIDLVMKLAIAVNFSYYTYEYFRLKNLVTETKHSYTNEMNCLKRFWAAVRHQCLLHPSLLPQKIQTTKIACAVWYHLVISK